MTYACFDVTRNAGIARIMHMPYRSKTYTWNDVILVKRSMIRVFFFKFSCSIYTANNLNFIFQINHSVCLFRHFYVLLAIKLLMLL